MSEDGIDPKVYAEALLFASDKPVHLRALMNVMGLRSRKKAREIMASLIEEYRSRGGAVEIVELSGEKFFMRLRPELVNRVKRHVSKKVLSHGVLRTLSLIAYYQPVQRTVVAAARGKDAYRQIKILLEKGLIEAEKSGKTQILKTSQLFAELIGVENTPQAVKKAISKLIAEKNQKQSEKEG